MNSILENWNLLCSRLDLVKQNNKGISALCPCLSHNDKNPSFSASYTDEQIVVYCHAGCTFKEIVSSLGMELSQFFAHKKTTPTKKIVDRYRYEDKDGDHVFDIIRFKPKDFRLQKPDG